EMVYAQARSGDMDRITRRTFLSGAAAGSAAALGLPPIAPAAETNTVAPSINTPAVRNRKLNVVVVGAHPDDPESGAGGTMARMADLGHEVVAIYLTRGEAGIAGKAHEESA